MRRILLFALVLYFKGISGFYIGIPSINLTLPNQSNVSNCTKYGRPPATRTSTLSGAVSIIKLCANITGHTTVIHFTDSNGEQRSACLLITSLSESLPLLVWLHPSLFPPLTILDTELVPQAYTANLTGTMNGSLGYHLLIPSGRDTTHVYPKPDDRGLGWDNWYRNYNRSDPTMNVDAQAMDYFIDQVVRNFTDARVDRARIFMSGWSNGASMALEYALNTPGIAAAAVYSAPDPYRDYKDACAQEPSPQYFTPILDLHNQCDIINICVTGKDFIDKLNSGYANRLTAKIVIIDSFLKLASTCNLGCTSIVGLGGLQHARWPKPYNEKAFFAFFRNHSLFGRYWETINILSSKIFHISCSIEMRVWLFQSLSPAFSTTLRSQSSVEADDRSEPNHLIHYLNSTHRATTLC